MYCAAGLGEAAISVSMCLGELGFDGDVDGGEVDAGPGRAEDDVGGFGIEPEVELVAGMGGELGVGGVRRETAAHDGDALRSARRSGDRWRSARAMLVSGPAA